VTLASSCLRWAFVMSFIGSAPASADPSWLRGHRSRRY
jgi:hypothetical protein